MQVMLKILRFFNLILNVDFMAYIYVLDFLCFQSVPMSADRQHFFYSDSAFLCHISPDSRVLHAQTSQRPVSKLALLNTTAP